MPHTLEQRVEEIRARARRSVWIYALGWCLAAICTAEIVLGFADYLLRPTDGVSRWLLTMCGVAAATAAAHRWLWNAWRFKPSLLATAQHIEAYLPNLRGRLSSSIAFLAQSEADCTAGSLALRRRVIAEAEAIAADMRFHAAVNVTPQTQGLLLGAGALAFCLVLSVADWQSVSIAAKRLAMPWSAVSWPRWHYLHFAGTPPRAARGADILLAVEDESSRLPEAVTLQIRFANGESLVDDMRFVGQRMVYRLDHVTQSFDFRAFGGDDDTMPWQHVEIVEPLALESIQLHVVPPAYAGPPWQATSEMITVLEGSRLAISGVADQLLSEATIVRLVDQSSISLSLDESGRGFSLHASGANAWQVPSSGEYALHLVSDQGLATDRVARWNIRLAPDEPPRVSVSFPADGTYCTPQALLNIAGKASDDLGLASISLRVIKPGGSDGDAHEVVFWQAPRNPLLATDISKRATGVAIESFRYSWDLAAFAPLVPGELLTWSVHASDFKPQSGHSPGARLIIVSPEEMQQRLVQRQASALAQLAEALRLQQLARNQIVDLTEQRQLDGSWQPRDRDLAHSAELHQRQVRHLVGRDTLGAAAILSDVLRDLESNRLDLPEMNGRCREILEELDRLERDSLVSIASQFAEMLRAARQDSTTVPQRVDTSPLANSQETVIATLEQLLGELQEWDTFQRIRRDISQLRGDQQSLLIQSQKLQAGTIQNPSMAHDAEARQQSRQQTELLRRFEKLQQRLIEFATRKDDDQAATQKAAHVAELATRLAIAAAMRDAARNTADLQLGKTLEKQQQARAGLEELLDALAGRVERNSEKSLQELRELASGLEALFREQAEIALALEKGELESAAKPQAAAADKAKKLADHLKSMQAPDAGESTQNAAQSMQKAAAAAQQKDRAQAKDESKQAEARLRQAKQQLQEQIAQRQSDLLREQMVRLEQHIQGLLARQQAVAHDTARLLNLQTSRGTLSPAQVASLGGIANEQEALAADARAVSTGTSLPAAFQAQLMWAADGMQMATAQLREGASRDVVALQQTVVQRLRMIVEALQPEPPPTGNDSDSPMANETPMPAAGDDQPPPDVHDLAELKLLRAMQAEVNLRTEKLENERDAAGNLSSAAQQQLVAIANEQGKVAELALRLVQSLGKPKPNSGDAPNASNPGLSDEELLRQLDEALNPATSDPPKGSQP